MQRYPHYLSGINLGDTPLDVMDTAEKVAGFGGAAAGVIALGSLLTHSRSTTLTTAGIASVLGLASLAFAGIKLSAANHVVAAADAATTTRNDVSAAFGNLGFGAGTLLASTLALLGAKGS